MSIDPLKIALPVIEKSGAAMIGSIDEDGYPNVKAMLPPREHDGLKAFYFTTNTSSLRVKQFKKNPKASLYFYDGGSFLGVMLKGKMEVLLDQPAKDRIWRKGDTMYYPKGIDDPEYTIFRLIPLTINGYRQLSFFSISPEEL